MKITKQNFDSEVLKSDKPVLINFTAPWWGSCQMIGPVLAGMEKEHPEYKVGEIDVDDDPKLAEEYHVVSIPHLVVIKGGEKVNETVGFHTKEELLELMK